MAHRQVADAYRIERVYDKAFDHLTAALALAPRDWALWDARARVSRDMGWVSQALPDAHRALFLSRRKAAPAHTTFATILHMTGQQEAALRAFQDAQRLDPDAQYANRNLCIALQQAARAADAVDFCARAGLPADPPR